MNQKELRPDYRFRLRAKMAERGFKSQKEFAASAGADVSTINNIMNAWRFPGPVLQRKIARTLGLTISELGDLL